MEIYYTIFMAEKVNFGKIFMLLISDILQQLPTVLKGKYSVSNAEIPIICIKMGNIFTGLADRATAFTFSEIKEQKAKLQD